MAIAKAKRAAKKPQTSKRFVLRVMVETYVSMTRTEARHVVQYRLDLGERMGTVKKARVTNADFP